MLCLSEEEIEFLSLFTLCSFFICCQLAHELWNMIRLDPASQYSKVVSL